MVIDFFCILFYLALFIVCLIVLYLDIKSYKLYKRKVKILEDILFTLFVQGISVGRDVDINNPTGKEKGEN